MTGGGTYVLDLQVSDATKLSVGAIGSVAISGGHLGYVGSAFGPGGFTRIDRHRTVSQGKRDTRHWHIDYLLGADTVTIADTLRFPGEAVECEIAGLCSPGIIPGFGCSDCDCPSHLFPLDESTRTRLVDRVWHG